jgi:hypothetical protein
MSTPQLDSETLGWLKWAHDTREDRGFNELYALVRSLRAAGWPLASISFPLGVSRETPRIWENKAIELGLPLVPVPTCIREKSVDQLRIERAQLLREERLERERAALEAFLPRLLALQPQAEALRGPSWASPENAAASAEYTRLLHETIQAGVRGQVLADALGVAKITVYARLRRSGLHKTSPSEKVPTWAKTEDWRHQLEGTRMSA